MAVNALFNFFMLTPMVTEVMSFGAVKRDCTKKQCSGSENELFHYLCPRFIVSVLPVVRGV